MKFPHTFFEDEVREGFYVSGIMKRAWAAQLEVLEEIDKVCKKHDVTWYADGGTLIGAVRHKGFIPWDDDIDVYMLREDYDRFNAVAKKELPPSYVVINMHTEEVFYEYLTRVTNAHGIFFGDEFLRKYHGCPFAVGVDVFPLDYIASDGKEEVRCNLLSNLVLIADFVEEDSEETDEYHDVLVQVEELCNVKLDAAKPVKQRLYEAAECVRSMYGREGATEVANLVWWVQEHRCRYPLTCFEKTVKLPFESAMLPAPVDYDTVLKAEYGDYMVASKKGALHGYPFFGAQERLAIDKGVTSLPEYQFKQEELKPVQRLPRRASETEAQKFVRLADKIHKMLTAGFKSQNHEQCNRLLDTCLEGVNTVRLLIVHERGETHPTVGVLDEYGELLREIRVMSDAEKEGAACGIISECLEEMLGRLDESVKKDILGRCEVVMLPWKASHWETLADMWRTANEDPDCDIYVVPIPYYEKNGWGALTEMHYEGEDFPDEVPIVHYEEYDFVHRHPDVIIMQNPYDEYNYTTSVAPEFYSEYLRQYTEKLVYIPWFRLDEIEDDDKKGLYSMRYFCTMPGVVRADRVIVQSEGMRKRYIDCLTEFAGENTREIWERKILGSGKSV